MIVYELRHKPFWALPQSGDIVDECHDAPVQPQHPEGPKFEELKNDLSRKTLKPVEQVLKDIGTRKEDIDDVLVSGCTRTRKIQSLLKDFFNGKEPSKATNPDEAVGWDVALQGGILSGDECNNEVLLVNVCPLTLGIKTPGGVFPKIIPCKTFIPTKKPQMFTPPSADEQPTVTIQLLNRKRALTKDNNIVGKVRPQQYPTGAT
ncbi:ATPase with role in protein import into the ER [Tulasnella sp. 424]|nr:ATPase with role in protein import into the ER [Tulasnella sp. 424]